MSASMAEGIAALLTEHGAWRYTNGSGTAIVCSGCGAPVGNLIAHQAEVLAANGYGKLEPEDVREAQARAYDKGYGHGKHDEKFHPAMSLSGTPRPEKNRRNPYRAVTERGGE